MSDFEAEYYFPSHRLCIALVTCEQDKIDICGKFCTSCMLVLLLQIVWRCKIAIRVNVSPHLDSMYENAGAFVVKCAASEVHAISKTRVVNKRLFDNGIWQLAS
jgi:hypothetical protein